LTYIFTLSLHDALPIFTLLILVCLPFNSILAQKLHRLNFRNVDEMYAYFQYAPGKTIISGHRGTIENQMPENSIASMKEVLKHTPAIFEIDPRLTKDKVPVMVHDASLERTTTGTGLVADYTWKEL